MRRLAAIFGLLLPLAVVPAAQATTVHGNFSGTNVDFLGVQETTTSPGDPEPMFNAPLLIGDHLIFLPTNFVSISSNGASDVTSSELEMFIDAKGSSTINAIQIQEFGETDLSGVGTAATSASVSGVLDIVVLEANGLPIAPVFIPGTVMVFTPGDNYVLMADQGFTTWSGNLVLDVSSYVTNATRVQATFKNILDTTSEPGTSAFIQKDLFGGPLIAIGVVPEPGTLALLGVGLAGLAVRADRRRGASVERS